MGSTPALPPVEGRFAINLIENAFNEVLLLKRTEDAVIGPGQWGLSSGHIEEGELPESCSRRELREELGPAHELDFIRMFGPVRDSFYGNRYELFIFHYRWLDGEVKLNDEHTDYAWVSRQDYRQYDVVTGIDEDIHYLGIWPDDYLNRDRLPAKTP